jgi:hypothetical protein
LQTEILEFQNREEVYAAKRTELLEIETAYRVVQQKAMGGNRNLAEKKKTQQIII